MNINFLLTVDISTLHDLRKNHEKHRYKKLTRHPLKRCHLFRTQSRLWIHTPLDHPPLGFMGSLCRADRYLYPKDPFCWKLGVVSIQRCLSDGTYSRLYAYHHYNLYFYFSLILFLHNILGEDNA